MNFIKKKFKAKGCGLGKVGETLLVRKLDKIGFVIRLYQRSESSFQVDNNICLEIDFKILL